MVKKRGPAKKLCAIEGCTRIQDARGLCTRCLEMANRAVSIGLVTWERLYLMGLALDDSPRIEASSFAEALWKAKLDKLPGGDKVSLEGLQIAINEARPEPLPPAKPARKKRTTKKKPPEENPDTLPVSVLGPPEDAVEAQAAVCEQQPTHEDIDEEIDNTAKDAAVADADPSAAEYEMDYPPVETLEEATDRIKKEQAARKARKEARASMKTETLNEMRDRHSIEAEDKIAEADSLPILGDLVRTDRDVDSIDAGPTPGGPEPLMGPATPPPADPPNVLPPQLEGTMFDQGTAIQTPQPLMDDTKPGQLPWEK